MANRNKMHDIRVVLPDCCTTIPSHCIWLAISLVDCLGTVVVVSWIDAGSLQLYDVDPDSKLSWYGTGLTLATRVDQLSAASTGASTEIKIGPIFRRQCWFRAGNPLPDQRRPATAGREFSTIARPTDHY